MTMNWTMDKDRYNEKTWRTQMAEDLSAEFVKWLIANGHADEAQKIGTGPDDFQMMDSTYFVEFSQQPHIRHWGQVKATAEMPPEGWHGRGPVVKVNKA